MCKTHLQCKNSFSYFEDYFFLPGRLFSPFLYEKDISFYPNKFEYPLPRDIVRQVCLKYVQ